MSLVFGLGVMLFLLVLRGGLVGRLAMITSMSCAKFASMIFGVVYVMAGGSVEFQPAIARSRSWSWYDFCSCISLCCIATCASGLVSTHV